MSKQQPVGVCVFNGWAATSAAWQRCAFAQRADCRIVSYLEQLDALDAGTLATLLPAGRATVLVGWSLGSLNAIRLAAEYPERVAGLVLVGATARLVRDPADATWKGVSEIRLRAMKRGLFADAQKILAAFENLATPAYDRATIFATDDDVALDRGLEFLRTTDVRACLDALPRTMPVAVFQSEKDGIVYPQNAAYIQAHVPQAMVTMVPGTEHVLSMVIPERLDHAVEMMALAHLFSGAVETYDASAEHHRKIADELMSIALPAAQITPGAALRVADIGSGTGILTERLAMQFPEAEITAVDVSEAMLTACRARVPRVATCCADALVWQAPEPMDMVVSANTFQWIAAYDALLANMRANLKPGGTLVVAELTADNLPELENFRAPLPYRDEHTIQDALTRAGFAVHVFKKVAVTVYYRDAITALRSFGKIGATYGAIRHSAVAMRGMMRAYEKACASSRGIPLTYAAVLYLATTPTDA